MDKSTDNISGSWFPTGYHGHFRSKTRPDFNIPYRYRARPVPPQKFLNQTRERSNRHLFSRHDNRNAHSDMGDLESFFSMGLGKRKFVSSNSSSSQHSKCTRDLISWKGNESDPLPVTTYRTQFERSSTPSQGWNSTEPIHVRTNLGLQRRHIRSATAPLAQHRTAPLLAWNEPDNNFDAKPGVGMLSQRFLKATSQNAAYSQSTPARSSTSNRFTVTETITPLNTR